MAPPIPKPAKPIPAGKPAIDPLVASGKPIPDYKAYLQTLADHLAHKETDAVIENLKARGAKDRDELEIRLIPTFAGDKQERLGIELRRILRFVSAAPTVSTALDFTGSGGKFLAKASVNGRADSVVLRSGVDASSSSPGSSKLKNACSITYSGADASSMHWLQFAWREAELRKPGVPGKSKAVTTKLKRPVQFAGRHFALTTNDSNRSWTIYSSNESSPFADDGTWTSQQSGLLAIFQELKPFFAPAAIQALLDDQATLVEQFHTQTYLVRGKDVLCRVDFDASFSATKSKPEAVPAVKGQISAVTELSGEHRACLGHQAPQLDYFAGKDVPVPKPLDTFDLVFDLEDAGWSDKKRKNAERIVDIAALAQAGLVLDLALPPTVNLGETIKAGLNATEKFSSPNYRGLTSVLDDQGNRWSNQKPNNDLRKPGIPQIAIYLPPIAFVNSLGQPYPKARAFVSMRHEMTHAAHHRLFTKWLIRWRDKFTNQSLGEWLESEYKTAGTLSRFERYLFQLQAVFADEGYKFNDYASQLLALAEGFVTGLPFLPQNPEQVPVDIWPDLGVWPDSIHQLWWLVDSFPKIPTDEPGLSYVDRVGRVLKSDLDKNQRKIFRDWMDFLIDPKFANGTPKEKEDAARDLHTRFSAAKPLLEYLKKLAID
jgi:hypothetical protein